MSLYFFFLLFFCVPSCESIVWWVFGPWPVHYRLVCPAVTCLWWISELQTEPPVSIFTTPACFCSQIQHRCKSLPLIRLHYASLRHIFSPPPCSCYYCLRVGGADKLTRDETKLLITNENLANPTDDRIARIQSLHTHNLPKRMKYISIFNWLLNAHLLCLTAVESHNGIVRIWVTAH